MAGLPWIKVWTAIGDHPKVQRLEKELGIKDALGVVVRLWCWTADYCPTGDIPGSDIDAATKSARGDACRKPPQAMVDALVTAGLLDPTPTGFRVHDWHDMQTVHVDADEKRRAAAAERQARYRERHGNASRNASRNAEGVTEKEKEREKEIPCSTVSRLPAPRERAGLRIRSLEFCQRLVEGLGEGLTPLQRQDDADELEQLLAGFPSVEDAVAFVAATYRKRNTKPGSIAWFLAVLRDAHPQGVRQ